MNLLGWKRFELDGMGDENDRDIFIHPDFDFVVKVDNPDHKHRFGNQVRCEWEVWKSFHRGRFGKYLAIIYWHGMIRGCESLVMEKLDVEDEEYGHSGASNTDVNFAGLLSEVFAICETQVGKDQYGMKKALDYGF
jgi:hypothetical protein